MLKNEQAWLTCHQLVERALGRRGMPLKFTITNTRFAKNLLKFWKMNLLIMAFATVLEAKFHSMFSLKVGINHFVLNLLRRILMRFTFGVTSATKVAMTLKFGKIPALLGIQSKIQVRQLLNSKRLLTFEFINLILNLNIVPPLSTSFNYGNGLNPLKILLVYCFKIF